MSPINLEPTPARSTNSPEDLLALLVILSPSSLPALTAREKTPRIPDTNPVAIFLPSFLRPTKLLATTVLVLGAASASGMDDAFGRCMLLPIEKLYGSSSTVPAAAACILLYAAVNWSTATRCMSSFDVALVIRISRLAPAASASSSALVKKLTSRPPFLRRSNRDLTPPNALMI